MGQHQQFRRRMSGAAASEVNAACTASTSTIADPLQGPDK
jgi:hypothetical protein